MPTYDYECQECKKVKEVFHALSETPELQCEHCKSREFIRLITLGAKVIFKGSGFFLTDNRPKPKSESASESKTSSTTSSSESRKNV